MAKNQKRISDDEQYSAVLRRIQEDAEFMKFCRNMRKQSFVVEPLGYVSGSKRFVKISFTYNFPVSPPFNFDLNPFDSDWKTIAKSALRIYYNRQLPKLRYAINRCYNEELIPAIICGCVEDYFSDDADAQQEALKDFDSEYLAYITNGLSEATGKMIRDNPDAIKTRYLQYCT